MRPVKIRRLAIGAFGVLCAIAVVKIAPKAGYFLVCSNTPEKADLILVIGGDFFGPRVLKGADLATQGYARLVLISGPPYQRGLSEGYFAVDFLASKGYPRTMFQVFGHHASNTIDEAVAVCGELDRRRVHRVLLVTSSYHSRRADIVFRLFCPGVHFTSVAAMDANYNPSRWWSDLNSRKLFYSECEKIVGTLVMVYPRYLLTGKT